MSIRNSIEQEKWIPIKVKDADIRPYDESESSTALDLLPYSGNCENDAKAELNEYQKQAREDLRKEMKRNDEMFDSEFWLAVYFQNRAQKEAFLAAMRILKDDGDKYIDGQLLAEKMGIRLPGSSPIAAQNKFSKVWYEFVI